MTSVDDRRRFGWGGLRAVTAVSCLSAVLLLPAAGQELEGVADAPAPEVRIEVRAAVDAWFELTPLFDAETKAWSARLPATAEPGGASSGLSVPPAYHRGAHLLCFGGDGQAAACQALDPEASSPIELHLGDGVGVTGRLVAEGLGLTHARVAVLPAELETRRPFLMPLAVDGEGLLRQVETDGEGAFLLPPLASGDYRLEVITEHGQVWRSPILAVPTAVDLRAEWALPDDEPAVWDSGEHQIEMGLGVDVRVVAESGAPLAGVEIGVRQGGVPRELRTFEARTDAEGRARIEGLRAEAGVVFSVRARGFLPARHALETLPSTLTLTLAPSSSLRGQVLGSGDAIFERAAVRLRAVGGGEEERTVTVDDAGFFAISWLAAGDYLVSAWAPGHAAEERFVQLASGEALELGAFYLIPGQRRALRIVDAESGGSIAGASVEGLSPPAAVGGLSDAEGKVSLRAPAGEALRLRLRATSYAPRTVTLSAAELLADEGPVIALTRGGWLEVEVAGRREGPCGGCRVLVGREELQTDVAGAALTGPLMPGRYRVEVPRIVHQGSAVVEEPGAEVRYVRIEAGKTSRLVFDRDRQPLRVRLEPAPPAAWRLGAWIGPRFQQRYAEASGEFELDAAVGRALRLSLRFPAPDGGEGFVEVGQAVAPENGRLRVDLPRTSLTGRLERDGASAAAVPLRLVDVVTQRIAAETRSGLDGSFQWVHTVPGTYRLIVDDAPLATVSLSPGRPVELGNLSLYVGER